MTFDLIVRGPAGLRDMRSELCARLDECEVRGDLADNVLLAACELATNGFRHGAADTVLVESIIGPDAIELRLRHHDRPTESGEPEVVVTDAGAISVGGRGLKIVDQICTWREVEVERGERFTRISFPRR